MCHLLQYEMRCFPVYHKHSPTKFENHATKVLIGEHVESNLQLMKGKYVYEDGK